MYPVIWAISAGGVRRDPSLPHCGEPVRLVPITTLVAGAKACPCDVGPDLIGPDDTRQRRLSPSLGLTADESDVQSALVEDVERDERYLAGHSEYTTHPEATSNGGY